MPSDEMLEVVEADPEARRALAARMAPLRPDGTPALWLQEGVAAGRFQIHQVKRNGTPIAVYWWWYDPTSKSFVVNAAGALVKADSVFSDMLEAQTAHARLLGAKTGEFTTARRGLVELAKEKHFVATGVRMVLEL